MPCDPTSTKSLAALEKLRADTAALGDRCLSLLLTGVDLYLRAGREMELLALVRQQAEEMREAIENTPSAQDLRRLFEN